ncbi:MAG: putative metal-binding motif-containing protein, partial [Myxococcota bacterium]
MTLARDYPPAAWRARPHQAAALVLYAADNFTTYRIYHLAVTQGPLDADDDGVCDGFDRCIGDDAAPDADGDGFPATCDCDDSRADVSPAASEVCDGGDQDCDGLVDEQRLAGAVGSELLGRIAAGKAESPAQAPAFASDGSRALVFPARGAGDAVVYRERLGALRRGDDPTRVSVDLAFDAATSASRELVVLLSDGARAVGAGVVLRVPAGASAARPHADAVYASDGDSAITVTGGGTRVGRYVDALATLRLDYAIPASGPATLTLTMVDAAGGEVSDSYSVPLDQMLDAAKPLDLLLVAPERGVSYGLASLRAGQALADADHDGICDGRDRCPGADDARDGDGDGVPDACDVCLGPDGDDDLDQDGVPSGCDCDDADAAVNPDAVDVCNDVDDDCDGVTDRQTALRALGAELVARLASGRARGGARPGVARSGGDAVEFPAVAGLPDLDIYYKEPLALLPAFGTPRRLRIVVDRDTHVGDHDFLIAVSDGAHVYGLGLFDVGGTGLRYLAAPIVGNDLGATVAIDIGAGVEVDEGSPYTLDLVLGDDARIDVTTASGDSVEVGGGVAHDGGRVGSGALSLVLIGQQASEHYLVRSVTVSQELPDADADGVCDAVDFCDG